MKKLILLLFFLIFLYGCIPFPVLSQITQQQIDAFKGTTTGTTTVTYSVTIAAVTATTPYDGQKIWVKFNNANTGAATLKLNSMTSYPITLNGAAVVSGDIPSNQYIGLIYYLAGTSWQLQFAPSASALPSPLPILSGGTNQTGLTSGSVLFFDGTRVNQANNSFFWSTANSTLGIGTAAPIYSVDVSRLYAGLTYSLMPAVSVTNRAARGNGTSTYNIAPVFVTAGTGTATVSGGLFATSTLGGVFSPGVGIATLTNDPIAFDINFNNGLGIVPMKICTTGFVGIGSADHFNLGLADAQLHLYGASGTTFKIEDTNQGVGKILGDAGTGDGQVKWIADPSPSTTVTISAGSNMTITSGGTPTSPTFTLNAGAGSSSQWITATSPTTAITYTIGNVGIGTMTTTASLHIVSTGSTSATSGLKILNSALSPSLFVSDNKFLGIGSGSPYCPLDVRGVSGTGNYFTRFNSADTRTWLLLKNTGDSTIFGSDGSFPFFIFNHLHSSYGFNMSFTSSNTFFGLNNSNDATHILSITGQLNNGDGAELAFINTASTGGGKYGVGTCIKNGVWGASHTLTFVGDESLLASAHSVLNLDSVGIRVGKCEQIDTTRAHTALLVYGSVMMVGDNHKGASGVVAITYTVSHTVGADSLVGGLIVVSSGTCTITLPTVAALKSALGITAASSFQFLVDNQSSGATTLATNTGLSVVVRTVPDANELIIPGSTVSHYEILFNHDGTAGIVLKIG